MVRKRKSTAYKCKGTISSLSGPSNICKRKGKSCHSSKTGQYINSLLYKQNGGTKSKDLNMIMKKIWDWCHTRKITLTVEHLPGDLNLIADWHSRNANDSSDWSLDRQVFSQILAQMGPLDVDLFASRLNFKLKKIVSWKPDPKSFAIDAFLLSWTKLKGYAFPPFSLIGRCLAKVKKDRATIPLIAPDWQAQPWYPMLLEMLIQDPVKIPTFPQLLLSPQGEAHPLTQSGSLTLAAWRISGDPCLQQGYQKRLQNCMKRHGDQELGSLTKVPGESGLAGVTNNQLIMFTPLWPI